MMATVEKTSIQLSTPVPGLSATNTLRLGATGDNLTGVLEQRFSSYRIQPVGPIAFTAANPRPSRLHPLAAR